MRWLLKYRFTLGMLLIISLIYIVLRLPNLTSQPIFADEAIYVRWAQVMRSEPTLRFLPLSDGKTPLFMWMMMPLFKVFNDPLFAGRFLAILSGYFTLLGGFMLGVRFFGSRVGLWAAYLIAITPMIVFFDRMALVDTMLSAFSIWALIGALELIKSPRLGLAMSLGYLLGGGWLTKTPGVFNMLALPLTLVAFDFKSIDRPKRFVKLALYWGVSLVIALVMMNILRLGPGFANLNSRNQDYVHAPNRLLQYPLDPFIPHLRDLADWFPKLLTWPVIVLVLGGVLLGLVKRNKVAVVTLLWSLLPLIVLSALLKTFTARYVLFPIPPLLCLGAFFIVWLIDLLPKLRLVASVVILTILTIFCLQFNLNLIKDPALANLPRAERRGYLEDWTAGYGLKEIATFLDGEARKGRIIVGTEGYFGTLPDGLFIYLDKTPNLSIVTGTATVSATLYEAAKENPTYYVANRSRFKGGENIELLQEHKKAVSPGFEQDAMLLYKVNPRIEESEE